MTKAPESEAFVVVDLTGQLSNPPGPIRRLLGLYESVVTGQFTRHAAGTATPRRMVRLAAEAQCELVAQYQAGATQRELADVYAVERRTAMEIIRRHGAQRKLGLSDAEVEDAIRRYQRGDSLSVIGRALGVGSETIRRRLHDQGIVLRPRGGSSRRSLR